MIRTWTLAVDPAIISIFGQAMPAKVACTWVLRTAAAVTCWCVRLYVYSLFSFAETIHDQAAGATVMALPFLLCALDSATSTFNHALRCRCVCKLAQCRSTISKSSQEASRSLFEIERIWIEVLRADKDDIELASLARETRARLLISLDASDGGHWR